MEQLPLTYIVEIPTGASVVVVEDSPDRIRWFQERIPNARFFSTPEDTIRFLSTIDAFPQVLFLDCDLDWKESLPGRTPGGIRVAASLSRMNLCLCRIVIHSVNENGAQQMKRLLPTATIHPFGTFEVRCR